MGAPLPDRSGKAVNVLGLRYAFWLSYATPATRTNALLYPYADEIELQKGNTFEFKTQNIFDQNPPLLVLKAYVVLPLTTIVA